MLISRSLGIKARFVSSLKLLPPIPTPKDTADSFQYTPSAWIEIFHPREKRWFPVDCIRAIVNCRQSLEIVSTGKAAKFPSLTHSFVIAVDELGYIVDVTKRYSSQYYGTSWHLRHLDEKYFFECLRLLNKRVPNPEVLYDEDAELEGFTQSEGIPEKLAGFHLHGRFVLENKLKKYEVFWPADKIVGQFKGENIHLRSCLQKVRSKDAWYTQFARRLKEGEEPVKVIQLPKRRKKGMLLPDEDPYEPGPMQPLYGEWQTEPYVPPVAIDVTN